MNACETHAHQIERRVAAVQQRFLPFFLLLFLPVPRRRTRRQRLGFRGVSMATRAPSRGSCVIPGVVGLVHVHGHALHASRSVRTARRLRRPSWCQTQTRLCPLSGYLAGDGLTGVLDNNTIKRRVVRWLASTLALRRADSSRTHCAASGQHQHPPGPVSSTLPVGTARSTSTFTGVLCRRFLRRQPSTRSAPVSASARRRRAPALCRP